MPTLLFIIILEILISLLGITFQFVIQHPIALSIRYRKTRAEITAEIFETARRRLLNLPFILGAVNLSMWTVISFIGSVLQYLIGNEMLITCLYLFFRGIMIGMIASTASFFLIERHSRNHLIPALFPEGGLITVSGTIKISMSRRLKALYVAGTAIPMKILVVTLLFVFWEVEGITVSAAEFSKEILIFTMVLYGIFIPIALRLNVLVGSSIVRPTQEMMRLVKRVRNGDFKRKLQVVCNDELGVLGDGLNEMTKGLRERDRMRRSLNLAMEIQQNLLPQNNPTVEGLDIAGKSIYCDETGGDYFDYFSGKDNSNQKISLVIGDVSGHGIPSALLMATGRAFLRQRVALSGSIASIVNDVNRQMARDIESSGRFMTLFFLTIEIPKRRLTWVRAGHDPAVLYDPAGDAFEELRGPGIPLGVNPLWHYEENQKSDLAAGQILLLGTDGLWEAQNHDGRMFGKVSVYEIIRQNAANSAIDILDALLAGWKGFIDGCDPVDDVTLIVVKIG